MRVKSGTEAVKVVDDVGGQSKRSLAKQDYRFAIVAARFNDFISSQLIEGVYQGLRDHGVEEKKARLYRVPGAMEIPIAAKWAAETGQYDSVICLGAVIRGATTHYEVVVESCASGIRELAISSGLPIIFGVLTTENIEQAIERSDVTLDNKGYEFAVAAIEMVDLKRSMTSAIASP